MTAPTLRADAARNLELILEAAEAAFAEKGYDACVADIAASAGVGQGTIFRRFETKDDLIAAVFERKLQKLVDAARAAGRKRRAWDGLMEFMATVTQMHMKDRGFFQGMSERLMENPHLRELKQETLEAMTELVDHAKAEGDLRDDITPHDIPAFCSAAATAGSMGGGGGGSRSWKHYLAVITDGMRVS